MKTLPLFFVHIPKTAGTSFRKSTEQHFNKSYVLYDYSPNSVDTSSLILDTIYKKNDFFLLQHELNSFDIGMLSGHVPASKYQHVFGIKNTITFLREPIQRLISEFQHFVRLYNYKGDFKSFYTKPQFINRQNKMLHNTPLTALGFVGLTDQYAQSLASINKLFSLSLENLQLNLGRENTHQPYQLDAETLAEVESLNKEDIALYKRACLLFTERQDLEKVDKPFVHGDVQQHTAKAIAGWAFYAQSDTPVVINVLRNNALLGQTSANTLRPGMLRLGLPRNGYVGFNFNFEPPNQVGDIISCQVAETGQILATITID